MKNTMFAALVALVAGCGLAHAGEKGENLRRYRPEEPAPLEGRRVIEETETVEEVVTPRACTRLLPFCSNENTGCAFNPRENNVLVLFGTHHREGIEVVVPNAARLQGLLFHLQQKGFCRDLPPAIVPVEAAPPVIPGRPHFDAGPGGPPGPYFRR